MNLKESMPALPFQGNDVSLSEQALKEYFPKKAVSGLYYSF